MELLPAIDLKNGACVRLKQGDMAQATVFNADPAAQASAFARQGAKWLHIVDLDGAFAGLPVNTDAVKAIRAACPMKTELGGGIRSFETIEKWLDCGITRVILGTIALKNPAFVKEACRRFPNQIAVGIDAKDGFVAVEGWAETSSVSDVELAKRFEDCGVCAIIHTDISRDGVMRGANLAATAALARQISTPVIVSGGISCLQDIRDCAKLNATNITGVITGRALYENAFTVSHALAVLKGGKP